MRTVKEPMAVRMQRMADACSAKLPRSRRAMLLLGAALSLLLGGVVAVWNVSSGPLHNLNDIGGWDNRLLFILMTAAVQVLLHLLLTALHRGGYMTLLLRHAALLAGFIIALLAINQKTYAFTEQLLPLIRQMDAQGLAAIAQMETNLSSSALTLIYLITRGPVYDMYLVKLACIAGYCVLCMMALHAADRKQMGIRAEVLFALCLILPQGFMSAACAAQTDVIAAALLAVSLALMLARKPRLWAGAVCYGLAVAVSGACLYALPVYAALGLRGRVKPVHIAAALGVAVALQLPAVVAGQPVLDALTSPLRAVLGVPEYAAGSPNLMNLFPRSAVEEMPGYFMLSQMPALDTVTNFSPYYTQAHFEVLMRGLALLGVAVYAIIWALALRRPMSELAKAFALALGALLACPGATAGSWLFAAMLAMLAILSEPKLRVSACLVLFATAGAAAYPVTGEVLLPMIVAMALCFAALFDLLGMFDANKKASVKA